MSMKMSFTSSTAGKKLKGLMHNNSFSVLTSGLRLQFKDLTIKVVSRQQKKKFATKTSGFRCFFFFFSLLFICFIRSSFSGFGLDTVECCWMSLINPFRSYFALMGGFKDASSLDLIFPFIPNQCLNIFS